MNSAYDLFGIALENVVCRCTVSFVSIRSKLV